MTVEGKRADRAPRKAGGEPPSIVVGHPQVDSQDGAGGRGAVALEALQELPERAGIAAVGGRDDGRLGNRFLLT
jgi:hypothetical protein